ncbi:hypothetical protein [Sulfitobacter dubius]|uniref:hypothetical protein n=1 Tax=Sulfitobacter dubius TaxID=218673 RepID=UPI0022AE8E50|nr:hypothetical protein [Sulfitobacter dubius]MCZ4368199.1 hypothetical protein [Sulfitobacter dubius]
MHFTACRAIAAIPPSALIRNTLRFTGSEANWFNMRKSFTEVQKIGLAVAVLLSVSTAHLAGFVYAGPRDLVLFLDSTFLFLFATTFTISVFTSSFLSTVLSWGLVAIVSEMAAQFSRRSKKRKQKFRTLARNASSARITVFAALFIFVFSEVYYGSSFFLFGSRSFAWVLLGLMFAAITGFVLQQRQTVSTKRWLLRLPFSEFVRSLLRSENRYTSVGLGLMVIGWAVLAISFMLGQEKLYSRLINSRAHIESTDRSLFYILFSSGDGFLVFNANQGKCHSDAMYAFLPLPNVQRVNLIAERPEVHYCR